MSFNMFQYKDDPMFAEFMEAHMGKGQIWSNDVLKGTGDGPPADAEDLDKKAIDQIPKDELASSKISDFEVGTFKKSSLKTYYEIH